MMKTKTCCGFLLCLAWMPLALAQMLPPVVAMPTRPPQEAKAAVRHRVLATYAQMPLRFEANQGQTDGEVKFLSRGSGYILFLTPSEAVLRLQQAQHIGKEETRTSRSVLSGQNRNRVAAATLSMQLAGRKVNPRPRIEGLEALPTVTNYFLGNDSSKWHTHVPSYGKVRYHEIYPGIDLVYYGNQQQLEYDFVLAPGANPAAIRLRIEGAHKIKIDRQGNLLLYVPGGNIRWHKPVVYQDLDGARREIAGRYVRKGKREVGFEVAAYDTAYPLIVDPILSYSTYVGGSIDDRAAGIAVDASGIVYITGSTGSTDFPTKNPFQATNNIQGNASSGTAFVAKFDTNQAGAASLLYSTYLGGSLGLPNSTPGDSGNAIAAGANGIVYVAGNTYTTDFPTKNAFQMTNSSLGGNAFLTKLDTNQAGPAGLLYSTYLGGSGCILGHGVLGDSAVSVAADANGVAYLAGRTCSTDFPVKNAFEPTKLAFSSNPTSFITKIDTAQAGPASLLYSTYLGGSVGDWVFGMAADANGVLYVAGAAHSSDFPTKNAYQPTLPGFTHAFVTKLDTTQAGAAGLLYSTYLGGSGSDGASSIALGANGVVYVAGGTNSPDFPVKNAYQASLAGKFNSFVTKLDTTQSGPAGLLYSSYLGGTGVDAATGIALGPNETVYIAGDTESNYFPTKNPFQPINKDTRLSEPFVAKLDTTQAGSTGLVYSTYLGGSGLFLGTGGALPDTSGGIAVDAAGNAYVTGEAASADFPVVNPFQVSKKSDISNAYLAKITEQQVSTTNAMTSSLNPSSFGQLVTFTATISINSSAISGPLTGTMDFMDGTSTIAAGVPLNNSGVASFSTLILAGGTHSITAMYNGDANHQSSTSSMVVQVVNNPGSTATGTTLAINITPLHAGQAANTAESRQSVMLTATVGPSPGSTGSVTFTDGVTIFGSVPVSGGAATLEVSRLLTIGQHNIQAVYIGDGVNFQGSSTSQIVLRSPRPK